jgi:hypothetical protein
MAVSSRAQENRGQILFVLIYTGLTVSEASGRLLSALTTQHISMFTGWMKWSQRVVVLSLEVARQEGFVFCSLCGLVRSYCKQCVRHIGFIFPRQLTSSA